MLNAQTIFTTDFANATFPPSVAAYAPVVAASSWAVSGSGLSRVTSGTSPTCSPHSVPGMLRYNSYNIVTGNASFISPVLNFTTPGANYTVSFWMYRDNGYAASADKLDVYVNTSNVAGGTLLGTVNRSRNLSPVVGSNGWYQYSYSIPISYAGPTNYLIFKFTSAFGNNCFVDDIVLTQTIPPPCSGTPTTTASGPATVCPNTAFTLSCTPVAGTGVTYQWKSASNIAGPYNNIVGATSASYTVASGIASTTYYQVYTTCTASGLNYTSNNITVSTLPSYVCSTCTSTATSTGDEEIWNVTLGTLNNSSTCATGNLMYSDYRFTVAAPTLLSGSSYSMSVNFNTCGGYYGRTGAVYIDYNQNGLFTDANENPWTVAGPAAGVNSTTITIPTTASFGITSMRVVYAEQGTAPPCGTYTWGETEDYIVNIAGINCTLTGSPFCGGSTVNVSYNAGGISFNAGNVFTAQLSDATGSFASPTNIGTLTSTANSGTIVCTIPVSQGAGTQYRVRVVSSNAAVTGANNGTDLVINPLVVPSVNITVSPGSTICAGDNVTFTALPTNGGGSPGYQWYVGASPVGGNTQTWSSTSLNDGDVVSCVLTSSAACPSPLTATSNLVTMTVNPLITPTVSVSSVPAAGNICLGQPVTFTATVTNGGPGPQYQWYKNGNPVGTNSASYVDNLLNNNDNITCQLTSNAPCLLANPVLSPSYIVTVTTPVTPSVSITALPGSTICAGDSAIFSATAVNGGPTAAYQWYVNGNPVGTNSASYGTASLSNGDMVSCDLTSSAPCASPANVSSNLITMSVNPVVTPTIVLGATPGSTICAGTSVTFTAAITNGGPSPSYAWTVNGNPAGANSSSYTSSNLNAGDVVSCTLSSSASCPSPASVSDNITMTVNPVVTPAVSITVNPGNTICSGSLATFTASATNGGPGAQYQWYKNGNPVGSNNAIYTDNSLNGGDALSCVLTSNAQCATPVTATSNSISMLVTPTVTPTVSVSNNTGNTICAGTNVTFYAGTLNGGNAPSYQWYLNGNPVGSNSQVYMNNSLVNGDMLSCELTSNAQCASPQTVQSSSVTMTVNPLVTPLVSITATPGNVICSGTTVAFDAFAANGGPSPTYTWYKNGNPVGSGPLYTDNNLNNSDIIHCELGSTALCATPAVVSSPAIAMSVTSNVTPSVSITANPGNVICNGSQASFSAGILNGGPNPGYQWYVNGNPVGTNNPAYSSTTLGNGDVVSCQLTSSYICALPQAVTSSGITMTVNPVVVPSVSILSSGDTICHGTAITFTASPVNGGPAPVYQWLKNNSPIGGPSASYSDNNFTDGDVVRCNLVSSDPCPVPAITASNSETITVYPWMSPKVTLDADPGVLMCSGAPVTFHATVDSAGTAADISYQWYLDGNPVGTNSPSYQGSLLNSGDMIYYIMTSTAPCLTSSTDTSKTDTVSWFNSGYLAGISGTSEQNTINISGQNNPIRVGYVDCDLISTIIPSGASPVSGNAGFRVTLDPAVNSYNGMPYVQRHYDIEPQNNAGTATATIELYAYENEFIAYNNAASGQGLPLLPTNKTDNGNVRVTAFHGTGTQPGNYTGATEEIIPEVSWDIADNWWVLRFPVTGFSGYYIHTGQFALSAASQQGSRGFMLEAWPNPVQDKISVRVSHRDSHSSLELRDLTGRVLVRAELDNDKALIDMSGLASGMYLLHYSDDTNTQTIKLSKK